MSDDTHFDVVVVGSGFGGSVAAYRLAEGGLRVCVLERGKAYPPGSFPRRPREMAANVWDPSEGLHGLFNVWSFRHLEAVVSSGLGGGSLVYANVLLRKDPEWFTQPLPDGGYEQWPVSYDDLEPHYATVERMLGAQRFPFDAEGYAGTPKTAALRDAARGLGLDWGLPNLAVTFANEGRPPRQGEPIAAGPYPNIFGARRSTCSLCGECDIGCNEGAKNTLDHTYLSAAAHHGADIRTRCEVRSIARRDGGYAVRYVRHLPEREGHPTDTTALPSETLTADRVVLAAGALGTPYLLLRNRRGLPGLSPALGTRFSGNGDLLTFLLRADRVLDPSRGPVITSYVRVPDAVEGPPADGPGFYVEDAGYPVAVDWLLEGTTVGSTAGRLARFAARRLWARLTGHPRSDLSAEVGRLLGDARLSAGSLPLLGMGRDVPDGRMRLRHGYLDVDWRMASSRRYFQRVDATMAAIAGQLGAELARNPLWALRRVVTVHPLGGAPMGASAREGVVDDHGEVFGQPGLHVADGSVMPGPIGPNPALTIAAFSDRMADRILAEGRRHTGAARARPAPVPDAGAGAGRADSAGSDPTALEFTEEMKGYVALGTTDPEEGFAAGRRAGTSFMFHLTIEVDDVDRFVGDPGATARARGWVDCPVLGGCREVLHGAFNLFASTTSGEGRNMRYRLVFPDADGRPVTLSGQKDVVDDPGLDVWGDTTTLFVRLLEGDVDADGEAEAPVRGAGVVTIRLADFLRQLTTFRAYGPTRRDELAALAAFGRLFLGELWDVYARRIPALGEARP